MGGLVIGSDDDMGLTGARRPLRVLGIGGSMRLGSKSLGALESALALAREAGAETTLASVRDLALPVYDPTIGLDG
ncbi:MAG: NAD(P)H-dependent oxidoreductase, partial [Chloroflexota bacterium]|nr:NAD(P)H-dependent oxidoreductase [Chloroflexota bacterium]